MLVEGIMKRRVLVVEPDARLALAACTMRDQDIGCLPVVEDGRLIGMITDRDIAVRGLAGGLDPHRATVRAVMSATAIACGAHDTVEKARDLMAANLIKHLPVVNRRKRVVGLVAFRDISGQFAKCKPNEVIFYKRLPNSSGHVHKVEVAKVYLSPAIKKDDAIPAAVARFEQDRGVARWEEAADLYEIKEPTEVAGR